MYLKRLIQSSNFDAAYEFFDNMREKGVACDIFDYSLMFLHTLYTSKEMFDFIESMDKDYNNVNIGTQNGILISRAEFYHHPLNDPIYIGLANQLVLEQGTSQAKQMMSTFLNERNYDSDSRTIRSQASMAIEHVFGRSSVRNSEMRTSLLMRLRERGKDKQFEWLAEEMYTNNVADIFQYEYLVKRARISSKQAEILYCMRQRNIDLTDKCWCSVIDQLIIEGHYGVAEHLVIENNLPIDKLIGILQSLNAVALKHSAYNATFNGGDKDSKLKIYELLKKLTTKQEKAGKEEMQSDDMPEQTEASRHFIDLTSSDTNNLHDFDEGGSMSSRSTGLNSRLSRSLEDTHFLFPNSEVEFLLTAEQQVDLLREIDLAQESSLQPDSKWSQRRGGILRSLGSSSYKRSKKRLKTLFNVMSINGAINRRQKKKRTKARRGQTKLLDRRRKKKIQKKIKDKVFEKSDSVSYW